MSNLVLKTLLVTMTVLAIPTPSLAADGTKIGFVVEANDPQAVLMSPVPLAQKWSARSLGLASTRIEKLSKKVQSTLTALKNEGAVRIVSSRKRITNEEGKKWKGYISKPGELVFKAYDSRGSIMSSTVVVPKSRYGMAAQTLGLTETECNLGGFNLFDISSWFGHSCEVAKPKPAEFLRAFAWQQHLQDDEMPIINTINSHWMEIEACLSSNLSYTVEKGYFDCPSDTTYFGPSRFLVREQQKYAGYEFTFKPGAQQATLTYLPPDYQSYADELK